MAELLIQDAARKLGVSDETVRRRVKAGELTARRDPRGRWLVLLPDVETAPQSPQTAPHVAQAPQLAVEAAPHAPQPAPQPPHDETPVLRELLAEVRARVDEQAETITDLRRRLDQAEERARVDVDRLQQLLAAAIATNRQLPEPASSSADAQQPVNVVASAPEAATDSEAGREVQSSTHERKSPRIDSRGRWDGLLRWLGFGSTS